MNAPVSIPSIWTTGTTEGHRTGTWRSSLALHRDAPSPCHGACPVHGDIASWIGLARDGDLHGAFRTLVNHNPFPAIAGRICHHPCETACNRAAYDEAVSICKLERHVGDAALAQGWALPAPEVERTQRVAIVGGGPAGLSAAWQLRRRGYRVTLIEAQAELGGLMRYGIPPYRLARDVLDGEVARIVALGVEVRCGAPLADATGFDTLRTEFDAVFVATGASRPKRLPQLDYSQPWAVDGAAWLAQAAAGRAPALGRRVLVVGGGSAALDVARSTRRAGHDVSIVALEPRERLPAQREEVHEALEEGISVVDSAMLKAVRRLDDGTLLVEAVRVDFHGGQRRGEFTLTERADSGFELHADAIVSSIGQDPDLAVFGQAMARDGSLLRADRLGATSEPGVWAGGDLASMARFVTEAIGMGERSALAIHAALASAPGAPITVPAEPRPEAMVGLDGISLHYHPKAPRAPSRTLPAEQRLASQDEVQLALSPQQAHAETVRCFSCGTCTHCDNCVSYCPDMAVKPKDGGYTVLTDYCKGCAVCVTECPTGSMTMMEEAR